MKVYNRKREILLFILVVLAGYNIILNYYLSNFLNSNKIKINYLCVISFLPDKITFVNFKFNNISCLFLTVDLSLKNLINKKYEKILEGINLDFFTFSVFYEDKKATVEEKEIIYKLPFIQKVKIHFGKILFIDSVKNNKLQIKNISGKSILNKSKFENEKYMLLNCSGNFNGRRNENIYLKLYLFPYYKNRFFLNLFGNKLSLKEFQPFFVEKNLMIEDGKLNFLIQLKGDADNIYVNNIIQFEKLNIKEDITLDVKEIFGLSVKKVIDFLKDSKGDFFVNFEYEVELKDANKILKIYIEKFNESIKNRIILGVVTAPIRQIKDLIWNLTGENIFRIIKIFAGE